MAIKHTGSKQPKLDFTKIAQGLGATRAIAFQKKDENGKVYMEITHISNGKSRVKKIYELNKKDIEAGSYKLLQTSEGSSLMIAFYMAIKHGSNILEEADGYYFDKPSEGFAIAVSFYKKK